MKIAVTNNGKLIWTLTLDYPTWAVSYHQEHCYQLRDASGELASDIWTRDFTASMIRRWRGQGFTVE